MKIKNILFTVMLAILRVFLISILINIFFSNGYVSTGEYEVYHLEEIISIKETYFTIAIFIFEVMILSIFWLRKKTDGSKKKKVFVCLGMIIIFMIQLIVMCIMVNNILNSVDPTPTLQPLSLEELKSKYSFENRVLDIFTILDTVLMVILYLFALIDSIKQKNHIVMIIIFSTGMILCMLYIIFSLDIGYLNINLTYISEIVSIREAYYVMLVCIIEVITLSLLGLRKNETEESKKKKRLACIGLMILFIAQLIIICIMVNDALKRIEPNATLSLESIEELRHENMVLKIFTILDFILMVILYIFALSNSKKDKIMRY